MNYLFAGRSSVLNPAIASTLNPKQLIGELQMLKSDTVLHEKLKDKLKKIINEIKDNMVARFGVILPFDEAQSMLMSEQTLITLQKAGKLMGKQYGHASYELGETITINLTCHGGHEMPSILFPCKELTMFSEDFMDRIRPLYLITKLWQDLGLAFDVVVDIVEDTRELNFYMPWLRYVFPVHTDLVNEFNGKFRVTEWLDMHHTNHSTINMVNKQVRQILFNEYTPKRTWLPSELVYMVRQGEELITQWNVMKSVPAPSTFPSEDHVSVDVNISKENHPTIKWAADAKAAQVMKRANELKEEDERKRK